MWNNQGPGTNRYFENYTHSREQDLLESLTIEAIKMFGHDMYYLPRTLVSYDPIYGEDDISAYNSAIPIEMYVKSVDGFTGDGTFLSKFGLEIRDQVTFTVARRIFEQNVGSATTELRPHEGDLIYFPPQQKLFQIQYTNYLSHGFYALGTLQAYDLTCELFEYSNERLNTGITQIDELQTKFSTNVLDYAIVDENGNYVTSENGAYLTHEGYDLAAIDPSADNEEIQDESENNTPLDNTDDVIDWSELDPFSEGVY